MINGREEVKHFFHPQEKANPHVDIGHRKCRCSVKNLSTNLDLSSQSMTGSHGGRDAVCDVVQGMFDTRSVAVDAQLFCVDT